MAYHIQHRDHNGKWRVSGFARSHPTAESAWEYAASLDQDGCIMPDVRVVDSTGKATDRPDMHAYQAQLMARR